MASFDFPVDGVMPKLESGISAFLSNYPDFDGRDVVVAIFDTGCDPGAPGLQVTSHGKPKFVDLIDSTGSGDVDTSVIVTADANNQITGLSGRKLTLGNWNNPSGKYHIGIKKAYELFPTPLITRLSQERKALQEKQQKVLEATILNMISASELPATSEVSKVDVEPVVEKVIEVDTKGPTCIDVVTPTTTTVSSPTATPAQVRSDDSLSVEQRKTKKQLEAELAEAKKLWKNWEDPGPVFDCVVFHDGQHWCAVIDTHEDGRLDVDSVKVMREYRFNHEYAAFSQDSQLNYSFNVYNDGNVLSIVVAAGSHGTHVAGIVGANFPNDPSRSGNAPGVQLISVKIGDSYLGTMETGPGLMRGLLAAIEHKVDMINMSYGEQSSHPNHGRFSELAKDAVRKHGIIFVSSAGNAGPCLSTVGSPGGTEDLLIGVGAFISPSMVAPQYSVKTSLPFPGRNYQWSSRGPTTDGALGVSISACGGAYAPVPNWTLQNSQQMNGTSMSSPAACGAIALLVSAMKQRGYKYTPFRVKQAIESTAFAMPGCEPFALGNGLLQVPAAWDYIESTIGETALDVNYQVSVSTPYVADPVRGVYIRANEAHKRKHFYTVTVTPQFPKWQFEMDAEDEAVSNGINNLDALLNDQGVITPPNSNSTASTSSTDKSSAETTSFGHLAQFSNKDKVDFFRYISLVCPDPWVEAADCCVLTSGAKGFTVNVDPRQLAPGVHYSTVVGVISDQQPVSPSTPASNRVILFRVPITVVVPEPPQAMDDVNGNHHHYADCNVILEPAASLCKYFEVPEGATWAQVSVRLMNPDLNKVLWIHGLQLVPGCNPDDTTFFKLLRLNQDQEITFVAPVVGGLIWELRVNQPWNVTGNVEFDLTVKFNGITVNGINNAGHVLALNATHPYHEVTLQTLRPCHIQPKAELKSLQQLISPLKTYLYPMSTRDTLPGNRTVYGLTVEYEWENTAGASEVTARVPALNGVLYESCFDAQMCRVYDQNKRLVGSGDAWPKAIKVSKGKYTVQVHVKHEKYDMLSQLKDLLLVMETPLQTPLNLAVQRSLEGCWYGGAAAGQSRVEHGDPIPIFIATPSQSVIPKHARSGDMLIGHLSLPSHLATSVVPLTAKELPGIRIRYAIPMPSNTAAKHASCEPENNSTVITSANNVKPVVNVTDVDLDAEVRDMKIKYLQDISADKAQWAYDSIVPDLVKAHPTHKPLFQTVLTLVKKIPNVSPSVLLSTADKCVTIAQKDTVAGYFGIARHEDDMDAAEKAIHKDMQAARTLLELATAERAIASLSSRSGDGDDTVILKNVVEAGQWCSVSNKTLADTITFAKHIVKKEYGLALQTLSEFQVPANDATVGALLNALHHLISKRVNIDLRPLKVDEPSKAKALLTIELLHALDWDSWADMHSKSFLVNFPFNFQPFF